MGRMEIIFIVFWLASFLTVTFPVVCLWRSFITPASGIAVLGLLIISFMAVLITIAAAIWVTATATAIAMTMTAFSIVAGFFFLLFYRFKGWDLLVVSTYYASMAISMTTFIWR